MTAADSADEGFSSGELDPRLAKETAQRMIAYIRAFQGQVFYGLDINVDRENLGVALDNLEETAAMLLNLSERLVTTPVPSADELSAEEIDEAAKYLPTRNGFYRKFLRIFAQAKRAMPACGAGAVPVAWMVELQDSQYPVDSLDDPQAVDDLTNHNAKATPLYYASPIGAGERETIEWPKGDWIEWAGGQCPVDDDALVEWMSESDGGKSHAGDLHWRHTGNEGDILRYRIATAIRALSATGGDK